MLLKIYWSTWVFFAIGALLLFATDNLTMFSMVVMGFLAFGLTFMGMMGVLPTMVAHPVAPKPAKAKAQSVAIQPASEAPSTAFHIFKSA